MPDLSPQSTSDSENSALDLSLKKLAFNLIPTAMLVSIVALGLKFVHSEPSVDASTMGYQSSVVSQSIEAEAEATEAESIDVESIEIEAKSVPPSEPVERTIGGTESPADGDVVWRDINDAISNLNELVGAELFLDLSHTQKGQMEVRLDKGFWERVNYQTRVDLKTDISDLWHLYATEYNYVDSSVVYFIDDSSGRVIDIFSKAD